MHIRLTATAAGLGAVLVTGGLAADTTGPTTIPLCPGLTIVTAVSQPDGDYESIKTIEGVTGQEVRLRYSTERLVSDMYSIEPPTLEKQTLYRTVRRADLETAPLYLQQFSRWIPETIPETTAIGTSAEVLRALKSKGQARLGFFLPMAGPNKLPASRDVRPNVYDYAMVADVTRVGTGPVPIPVLVNDTLVNLPAVHAAGDFFGEPTEFFFLDDPANPLALKFRYGIDRVPAMDPEYAKAFKLTPTPVQDRDTLQVIKIRYACTDGAAGGGTPSGAGAPASAGAGAAKPGSGSEAALERALVESGRADLYSIYFTFNSDVLREESEPTLAEIAGILSRHAGWRLQIHGHTDGIGTDAYNLDLSRRRAAAVKDALVRRHGISPDRLSTAGMGKAQPRDRNDTLEGRARNRRVELIRQ